MHQSPEGLGIKDGVLIVDKPTGMTSHDVVVRVRRATGIRRVGHTGTLDPLATGVLPLVFGQATRLAPFLSATTKTYEAVFRLGVVTDTYDITGNIVKLSRERSYSSETCLEAVNVCDNSLSKELFKFQDTPNPTENSRINFEILEDVRTRFLGSFWQQPPQFSAKKIKGVRSYKLARHQKQAKAEPVKVTVYDFEFLALENERLKCRVTCSPGFYVRALAHEIGIRLGCGACVEELRRESSAGFSLEAAVPLDVVEAEGVGTLHRLTPLSCLLPHLPAFELTDSAVKRAGHGNTVLPGDARPITKTPCGNRPCFISELEPEAVKLFDRQGTLIAIAETAPNGFLHPTIVLV